MDEERSVQQDFYVDEETLGLIVEALLTKIKENVGHTITKNGTEDAVWKSILTGLTHGVANTKLAEDAVSLELLAELIAKGGMLSYQVVEGTDIKELVKAPATGTLYLLKNPTSKNPTNVTMWMNPEGEWLSLGDFEFPELTFVDVEEPHDVANIVAHVNRGDNDFAGSTNVHAEEIVTAQALTNVLIALGYSRKEVIPYAESQGKSISEVVGKPNVNTFYAFQQSANDNDWAVYTPAPVTKGTTTKYVWLKISGAEGSAPVEVDLSNYWTKDELKPLTPDLVTDIINRASANVGI